MSRQNFNFSCLRCLLNSSSNNIKGKSLQVAGVVFPDWKPLPVSILNTLPAVENIPENQTAAARCLSIGDKALQTSVQTFCMYACLTRVCTCIQVCVCAEGRGAVQSGRMYEHARPAGVNKELITLSLLQAEEKPTEEPCYLTYYPSFLSCMVICGNNVTVTTR